VARAEKQTSTEDTEAAHVSAPICTSNWLSIYPPSEMAKLQKQDLHLQVLYKFKEADNMPAATDIVTDSAASSHYWILWQSIMLVEGVLVKEFYRQNGTAVYQQLLVSQSLKNTVMDLMHDSLLSGHLGTKKTKENIKHSLYWYILKEDVELYIARCYVCAADKPPTKRPKAHMGYLKSGAPWDVLAIEYLGPLPITALGNRYILV
jgi:hypothetical protein